MPDVSMLIESIDLFLEASRKAIRDEALLPIERHMEKAIASAFRAQSRAFLKRFAAVAPRLPGILTDDDWLRYLDAAMLETKELFMSAEKQAVTKAITAGIKVAASESGLPAGLVEAAPSDIGDIIAMLLGIRFDLKNPRAVAYIDDVGANLVTRVDETTRDYIRTVISEGVANGDSYNAMAKRISARYSEFAVGKPQLHIDSRAHLIAVTEAGQAYEHGNYMVGEGLRDAGLNMEKSWLTFGDSRVSAGCAENEAAGWIPFDDAFPSGDLRPLRFPGCRCSLMMQRVGAGKEAPETVEKEQGVPRFTSAKEAEAWVRQSGLVNGQISFKGFDTETSQSIVDSLNANTIISPTLTQAVGNIGNNRDLNALSRETRRAAIEARAQGGAYARILDTPAKRERWIQDQLRKGDIKMMPNVYAQAVRKLTSNSSDIYVAYDYAHDSVKMIESLKRNAAIGWFPEGASTVKGVIDHELGHAWAALHNIGNDSTIKSLWLSGTRAGTISLELSTYATQNISEFIAEGWAEFLNNPTPRALARSIGARMLEIIGRP